ncbi:hypothetical protein TRIUR3_28346 [Triticum urartu]|uniref:Uncharacterized protein n=1 Tax=Triticum urartu TaxID=4572 RepID=M8AY50_TRIUA|nr:hypothetical protein TRIUR3_28346 [Triticum urartu]
MRGAVSARGRQADPGAASVDLAAGAAACSGASGVLLIQRRKEKGPRERGNIGRKEKEYDDQDSGRRRTVEEGWLASSAHAIQSKGALTGSYQTRQPQKYIHDNLMGDNSQNLDRALCFTGLHKIISIVLQRESIHGDLSQSFDSNVTLAHYESNSKAQTGETKPFKPYSSRYPTPYKASGSTSVPYCYSIKRASTYIIVLASYSAYSIGYTLARKLPKAGAAAQSGQGARIVKSSSD